MDRAYYDRRVVIGCRYAERHLLPLMSRLYEIRSAGYLDSDMEWAIPREHAVEAQLSQPGNLLYGIPIVVDDGLAEPMIRVIDPFRYSTNTSLRS